MTTYTLTKTRLYAGIWEGVLTGAGTDAPQLRVTHLGEAIDGVEVKEAKELKGWLVHVPIPANLMSDGVQTFIISDEKTGMTLNSFALLFGEVLAEDIRAEMGLLREELDLLKRSFRRLCVETS